MRIGVIASMKQGLEHFVYRELVALSGQGFAISLFPTKFQRGLYNARPEWSVHRWYPAIAILIQPFRLLRNPRLYLSLLREALGVGALSDFLVAWYFAPRMAAVDVIYATFGDHKLFVGYFCKRITRRPLVVAIHAYELYQNPNPRLFPRALAACDQIITVTEYNRELLASRYGIESARIEVVRIGVDTDAYRPSQKFVILIVAFFAERKGHDVLLQAVKQLGRDDLEVWVVGDDGPEEPVDVRGMVAELGLESHVAFFGKLSGTALEAVYRACDVVCLPCRTDSAGVAEGFPTVLAEAMAFGKPVITTRHVEIPRILDEILVDEGDVHALAQAIDRVSRSDHLRQRLGANNRQLAKTLFSLRNTERTANIFRTVVCQDVEPGVPHHPGVRQRSRGAERVITHRGN